MAILVAVDESNNHDRVVSVASDLASAHDTQLHALHVVSQDKYDENRQSMQNIEDFRDYSVSQQEEGAANIARSLVSEALGDTANIEPIGRVGEPVQSILEVAKELDAQYIVIGGRKRSPTGKVLFGSTTQSVLLGADRPVVTVLRDSD